MTPAQTAQDLVGCETQRVRAPGSRARQVPWLGMGPDGVSGLQSSQGGASRLPARLQQRARCSPLQAVVVGGHGTLHCGKAVSHEMEGRPLLQRRVGIQIDNALDSARLHPVLFVDFADVLAHTSCTRSSASRRSACCFAGPWHRPETRSGCCFSANGL